MTYSKQLSYAGRIQVINVVSFAIYNFLGVVFIVPHCVLKELDSKCRKPIWFNKGEKESPTSLMRGGV